MTLEMKVRLETGLKFLNSSKFRLTSFNSRTRSAVFSESGTMADELTMKKLIDERLNQSYHQL